MPTVIGWDVSTSRTGWAVIVGDHGRPMRFGSGVLVNPRGSAIRHAVEGAIALAIGQGASVPTVAVIERPFLMRGPKSNPDVAITLGIAIGRYVERLDAAAVPVELITAQAWQMGLLKGLITGKSKRDERKAAAKKWVLAYYKHAASEDEADAICMATWEWLRRARG